MLFNFDQFELNSQKVSGDRTKLDSVPGTSDRASSCYLRKQFLTALISYNLTYISHVKYIGLLCPCYR